MRDIQYETHCKAVVWYANQQQQALLAHVMLSHEYAEFATASCVLDQLNNYNPVCLFL